MPLVRFKYASDARFNVKLKIFYHEHTTPKYKTLSIAARNKDHAWELVKQTIKSWENVKSFRMLFIENTRTGEIYY
jgi:hypothetical protein